LPEFYKYVKRRKEYTENIPAIKDYNGRPTIDPIEEANSFNYYYSLVFSSEGNIQHVQCANSGEPFTIDAKIVRKRAAAIGKNKSISRDGISGGILKLGREAMIPYLARSLNITMNNGTLAADWKRAMVFPVHGGGGGDRSLFTNYRPVSLNSVVCKQMEHVRASYLRQVSDKNDGLYEGQHGFRPGYSCER